MKTTTTAAEQQKADDEAVRERARCCWDGTHRRHEPQQILNFERRKASARLNAVRS